MKDKRIARRGPSWHRSNGDTKVKDQIDIYETNPEYIDDLLRYEPYEDDGSFLEPCWGINKFLYNKLGELFTDVEGFDIIDKTGDFLTYEENKDYIITNPPFNINLEFIEKAQKVANKKISFLVPLNYLDTMKRYHILNNPDFPVKNILVYSKRISFIKGGGIPEKCMTGMSFCWVTWDRSWKKEAEVKWIKTW